MTTKVYSNINPKYTTLIQNTQVWAHGLRSCGLPVPQSLHHARKVQKLENLDVAVSEAEKVEIKKFPMKGPTDVRKCLMQNATCRGRPATGGSRGWRGSREASEASPHNEAHEDRQYTRGPHFVDFEVMI